MTSRPLVIASPALPDLNLIFDTGALRLRAHVVGRAGAVSFAESVTAGNQGNGLFVVHGHTAEGLADVTGCRERIGVAVRAFGIHVDQAHLHGSERTLQIAVAAV